MKIELNVSNKGNQIGTCGWLKDILTNARLEISKTKKGLPAIVLITKNKDNSEVEDLIAFVSSEYIDGYYSWGDCVWSIFSAESESSYMAHCFAGYLTPAALDLVDSLISQAVKILKDYLQEDAAEFEILIQKV